MFVRWKMVSKDAAVSRAIIIGSPNGELLRRFLMGDNRLGALEFRSSNQGLVSAKPIALPSRTAARGLSPTPRRRPQGLWRIRNVQSRYGRQQRHRCSKKFYDAVFQAVGGKPGEQDAKGRLRYAHNGGVLMVSKPIDGKPATHSNGGTIGLLMASPEQAAAWHKAGVANGGTSIEDPPGFRGQTYLAYIRDPDGNKLCALCRPAGT